MRIISGTFKGRRFEPLRSISARPTTDFAKEGLFNVLNNQINFEETTVLDLFAGIGSIGLEFASRDCPSVTMIEKSEAHIRFIRKVILETGMDNAHIIRADVFRFLNASSQNFDLIFADPPYELPELSTLPNLVFEHNLLKPEGIFILEHPKKYDFAEHPRFLQHKSYGNVQFSFFSNR
jgi:16S rRNA (guanine(966)-N(2))-methyltransferase RsmD